VGGALENRSTGPGESEHRGVPLPGKRALLPRSLRTGDRAVGGTREADVQGAPA